MTKVACMQFYKAPAGLQKGPNGGVVSIPLPINLLSLACVCEERSQTGQAQFGLSCKATKCSDAGTGDLGVLTTHETLPMKMTTIRTKSKRNSLMIG